MIRDFDYEFISFIFSLFFIIQFTFDHFHPDYISQCEKINFTPNLFRGNIVESEIWYFEDRSKVKNCEGKKFQVEKCKTIWVFHFFFFFLIYKKRYFSVKHFSFPTRYQYQFKYRTVTKVFGKKKKKKMENSVFNETLWIIRGVIFC